jgi:hypothetical protein
MCFVEQEQNYEENKRPYISLHVSFDQSPSYVQTQGNIVSDEAIGVKLQGSLAMWLTELRI